MVVNWNVLQSPKGIVENSPAARARALVPGYRANGISTEGTVESISTDTVRQTRPGYFAGNVRMAVTTCRSNRSMVLLMVSKLWISSGRSEFLAATAANCCP